MELTAMHFAALPYLYLLWLVPALLVLYVYAFARKRHALALFIDLALAPQLLASVSRLRQWLKALCLVAAVACLVLALTQPQWGRHWQDVPRRGRDLIILLDVSRSMLAEDVAPNRLQRAKIDIKDLVQVLHQEGGHRLGLVVFAGRASLQCPLTLDYAFFLQKLNEVGPDTAGRGGTLIGDAIRLALHGFGTLDLNYKDIILITDGEDHDSFPLEAATAAAEQQVSIYTVGIGDPKTGTRIPIQDPQGGHAYVRYQGQEVRSRMHENLLLEMAQLTGGAYVPAGTRAIELDRIYATYIAPKARRHLDVAARQRFVHRFQWFVLGALLFLITEMLVSERKVNTEE
jgi:Ca-activated chloride channel family protein